MKIIGVLQARMGASRFPGKILAPLLSRPMLAVIMQRVMSAEADEWWLATSDLPGDRVAAAWGRAMGWNVHCGSEDDVLSRFTDIVRTHPADWVVRLTADNPFTDAGIINVLIRAARAAPESSQLIGAPDPRQLPLGYAPSVIRARALLEAARDIPEDQPHHRANVTSWTARTGGVTRVTVPESWPHRAQWRWTVDTEEDYRMTCEAFHLWEEQWRGIAYPDMVVLLDEHPEIVRMNEAVRQKDGREG